MFDDLDEAGIRIVVRNGKGEVMAALSRKIAKPSSVELLELLVARRVPQFVQELGFCHSIFEGDSMLFLNPSKWRILRTLF